MSHNVIYVDQPDLALPRTMYLDTESYADYIAAYKTFMLETAMVMARYVMKFVCILSGLSMKYGWAKNCAENWTKLIVSTLQQHPEFWIYQFFSLLF